MKFFIQKSNLLFLVSILFTFTAISVHAQDNQTEDLTQTREITSDAFTKKRPVASKGSKIKTITGKSGKTIARKKVYKLRRKQMPRRPKTSVAAANPKPSPKPDSPKTNTPKIKIEAAVIEQLGITMWRLRPEKPRDTGARLLTQGSKLVAERVSLETVFRPKDKVRISIESPQAGFLYIIDREMFSDGTLGKPFLIFPTLNTRRGNNYVTAGVPIEIPAQTDEPFYFEITPFEENYTGELITVILSPVKMPGLQITNQPLELSDSQVEDWEDNWEQTISIFELDKDDDEIYTEEEKQAGSGTRQLTQNSPPPKSMVTVKTVKGKAFLISFAMKVKD